MASDDKKIKTNSAPEKEAPTEKKGTSDAELSKADGGELAGASPSGYSEIEIARLHDLEVGALRACWHTVFRRQPPNLWRCRSPH